MAIEVLSEIVANQIAAGEVVNRPASVVKELLENSIDSGADEILLIIKDAGRTLIQVKDNGCGIPEERIKDLFMGYLDREGSAPTDGTRNNMGIGLSVCSTIIKVHGGSIYAKNRPEGGSLFGFSLRLEEENE